MKESEFSIIEYLKSFNRKERFYLVGQLTGNTEFKLDQNIFSKLLGLLGIETPSYYFSAMDYHLDWIYASLALSSNYSKDPRIRDTDCITASSEDVDFIISFLDEAGITHVIMIEAKGDTSFTNSQILSKANRLNAIFGPDGSKWKNVKPYFILCSPVKPTRLQTYSIPSFMLTPDGDDFLWYRLYMPACQRKVTRCTEKGCDSKEGLYWKVDNIRELKN